MSPATGGTPFFGLDDAWSRPDDAAVVILPIPYEETTSCGKGTALAPDAVREASCFVELYDEELDTEVFRLPGGIATAEGLHFDSRCRDACAVEKIKKAVTSLIERDKMVVGIGGEHTIAIGTALAHAASYERLSILQLDAHSDLRQEYEGNRYSHACAMARIYDVHPDIVQIGIRSQCMDEAAFIREKGIKTFYAHELRSLFKERGETLMHRAIIDSLQENVYLTLDCDFFDPSVVPALGTPEPGGFDWDETTAFLRALTRERKIVGFDVNELAPIPSLFYPQFAIAKLIYKLIGYIFSHR